MKHSTKNSRYRRAKSAILLLFAVQLIACEQAAGTGDFQQTYQESAVAVSSLPEVVASHPRLLIRRDPWQRGPSLQELRQWAHEEPLKSYLERKPWSRKPDAEWAFRYLITGDENLVLPIVKEMKKEGGYWPGYLKTLAVLYDWIYESPTFSQKDKNEVEDKILSWGNSAVAAGQKYHDMWSHYGMRPVTDLAAAGLALHGRRPEAEKFMAMAIGYMKQNIFRGWSANDGAWLGGWAYYGQGPAAIPEFIAIWSSATHEDLYGLIEREQGDWLRRHLYFLLSTKYPDGTPFETVGFSYTPNQKGARGSILKIGRAYRDPLAIKAMEALKDVQWWAGIGQFMYFTPEMRRADDLKGQLPLTQIWGKDGVGYVQMRSGWKDTDTVIDFKCGDYFWSHQFQNQNAFTIYRNGKLAIQSGLYDDYFGSHMLHYYRPTVGSNSMLIVQPGEMSWVPPGAAKKRGVRTEDGFFPEWGGQRSCYMVPKLGSAETCFGFDKYLYRKDHEHHFETGNIEAQQVTDRYSYVLGNATSAYNNPGFTYPGNKPKIDLFTREMVYLDGKYLVVFDRVNALDPHYEKRWLLHTIGEPQMSTSKIDSERTGHIEMFDAGLIRTDNEGGTLFCQTLFPEKHKVRKVGGGATVGEVRADPANKGNAGLSTDIEGEFRAVAETIATDAAREESWTIQFTDATHFTATGSVTGKDGSGSVGGKKSHDFLSDSRSLFIPASNWHGTPEKGDKFYFSVTSPSYRFWVNGKNWAPSVGKMVHVIKDGSRVHPGNWRIEVSPREARAFDTFLHLLYPCDRNSAQPPAAKGIASSEGSLEGLAVDGWCVLFPGKRPLAREVDYRVDGNREVSNLILGLEQGGEYVVRIVHGPHTEERRLAASRAGTLFFSSPGQCTVHIVRR